MQLSLVVHVPSAEQVLSFDALQNFINTKTSPKGRKHQSGVDLLPLEAIF